jgi:hypothetical protein
MNGSDYRNLPDVTGQFEDALLRNEMEHQPMPGDISMIDTMQGVQDQSKLINITDFSLQRGQFGADQ